MKANNNTQVRIGAINTLIKEIGSHDRYFYAQDQDHKNPDTIKKFSKFFIKEEQLWFLCSRCGQSWKATEGSLQNKNCNGHTLNAQLESFREFIKTGRPTVLFTRYWGYKYESLIKIHNLSTELGICLSNKFTIIDYETDKEKTYNGETQ